MTNIGVTVEPLCPASRTCNSCSAAQMTAGACLPGVYRATYTATDTYGNVAARSLNVSVEEVSWADGQSSGLWALMLAPL